MTVFVASLTTAWTAWRFRAALPELEGQHEVQGLNGPVVIARDEHGVPHIFGETEDDVFFGLGYAHAQDRFFQMHMIRRAMEGRLAETIPSFIGGEALVRADVRTRIKGYHLAAQAGAANLSGAEAAAVDAYAAGVNALILSPGFVPPPEHTLLGLAIEPWDAADTAAVWVYMADQLVAGAGDEYRRNVLRDVLSPDRLNAFVGSYPPYGENSLDIADIYAANPSLAPQQPEPVVAPVVDGDEMTEPGPAIDESGLEVGPTPGSNNWVVNGDHTQTGSPLLANDPHLDLGAPSIWYMARLALPDGDVVGYSLPGTPFIVLGRNESIAWGFTNTGYDVQDYRVRPTGTTQTTAREEIIKVRFGQDVTITAHDAPEGPLLDPAYFNLEPFGEDVEVVLQTTADDRDGASAATAYTIMKARNWDAFVEAGRTYIAPMQNMVYADVDGNIGYVSPGRVPLRDANGDWTGEIPFEDLPKVLNPRSGVIATANNQIVPDGYPYPLNGSFAAYRISRIHDRLAETSLHDEIGRAHV